VALIGPSGCGKSTVLRCLNRMNDLIAGFKMEGAVSFGDANLYDRRVDPVAVRRKIGMVFQQPNPFASSIFNNVAFGLRRRGYKGNLAEKVEQSLRQAALWDEVKDKLHTGAQSLSGGQQQRLCIARTIAPDPEVILMDEPCSALDPIAAAKIEELIQTLKERYTIVIVTHNLHQARRIADWTAFLYVEPAKGGRTGYLVEYAPTNELFDSPKHDDTRDYLMGRFG
jgi:phosphate transport system ATP-binding protein